MKMGYFSDEDLDVQIQPVDGAVSAVQAITNGRAFMTYASLHAAVAAYQEDPSIAIIGLTKRTHLPRCSARDERDPYPRRP